MSSMRLLRVIPVCSVALALIAAWQVYVDSGKKAEAFNVESAANDQTVEYKVCTTGSNKSATSELPLAHKSSPSPASFSAENYCSPRLPASMGSKQLLPVCEKLFAGEELTEDEERWILQTSTLQQGGESADMELLRHSMDCDWVRKEVDNGFFVSDEERRFPIAYAINLNQYPSQVLRFLRAIYRPHNVYCLHCDIKSDPVTKEIMLNVASCLGNVIVSRKVEDVYWGWYTIKEAYFNCFSELMLARDNYPWKYVITLCGKELPLRTNAETVALLKPLNGTSSVQTVGADGTDNFKFKWKWSLNKMTGWITKRDEPLPPIPYGLKVYKSWAYVALSYQFVEHILCSPMGNTFREYMKDVRIPEENFYIMLFMHPGTPGGFRPEKKDYIFPVTRYIWLDGDHHGWRTSMYLKLFPHTICVGRKVHNICMLGAKDLHRVSYRPGVVGLLSDSYLNPGKKLEVADKDRGPLFHNRYILGYDSVPMECMEQELARRNRLEHAKKCRSSSMDSRLLYS